MDTSRYTAQDFYDKVEYEGGLVEYLTSYSQEVPEDLQEISEKFLNIHAELMIEWAKYRRRYQVDDLPF